MKKILILRTLSVPKVWESIQLVESTVYRGDTYFKQILRWEPFYASMSADDISFATGLYTKRYHECNYQVTPGENQPSLIKMIAETSMLGHKRLIKASGWGVKFNFKVVRKLTTFDRGKMLELDSRLISAKKSKLLAENDSIPKVDYNPLSFTLNEKTVAEMLGLYGVQLHELQLSNSMSDEKFIRYRKPIFPIG